MPITTTTTVDTTIPELWSPLTADYREAKLNWINYYDRRYEAENAGKAYDTIHIQGVNSFQDETGTHANTLGVGGTLTFDAARYQTQVNLLIDTHAYQAFDLEWEAELMSNISTLDRLAKAAAYAVAHRIDDSAAAFADDDTTEAVGSLGVALTDADVRTGRQFLDDALAPMSERFFVFSHAEHNNFMDVEKYVNNLYREVVGSIETKKYEGYVGNMYGMDWYANDNVEGTNAAGHDGFMFHKESIAVAVIDNMRNVEHYEISTDSTRYAVHSIYGMIAVRTDHGVFCRGL